MQLALPLRRIRFTNALISVCLISAPLVAQQMQPLQDPGTSNQDPGQTYPSQMRTVINASQPTQSQGIVLQGNDQYSQDPNYRNSLNGQFDNRLQNPNDLSQYPNLNSAYRAPQPPPPPTEFQNLVKDTLGRSLPIYGANLFRNTPSTFAPVDRVPVTPDYTIGPGDELLIQTWGQVTLNSRFTVDRTGSIYIPQVGTVHVAGLHFAQLQDYLKSQMGRMFRNFDLNVNMGQLRSIQIFVVGQTRRPGSYTVSSLSTLVNALFVTGGPSPQGSMRHIELKRDGKVVTEFDLYDLLLKGDKSKDAPLLPGDVIYIPNVGPQVAVAGSVNTPAIYEVNPNSTVADAVELAGGLTSLAMTQNLRIERVLDRRNRGVVEFQWTDQGRSTPVENGDILEFPTISDQFKDAVTLRGNVANPGRYAWHPGMRIRDLIPSRESLITQNYWQRRARLGESTLTYIPLPGRQDQTRKQQQLQSPYVYPSSRNSTLSRTQTPDQMESTTQDGTADTTPQTSPDTSVTQAAPTTDLDLFSGGAMTQQAGALSPSSPGTTAAENGSSAGQSSTASAQAGSPSSLFQPKNFVIASGPDIDWGYAVIDRQDKKTLVSSLIPFNLGAAVLNDDESQNLELQPEDVVTIFSKADIRVPQSQQTRYVRLEGEFVGAGVYTVRPGETLRQLVARAGGLTSEAYLFGSEFTRESTRREQQQRLNDYANKLEQQATSATVKAGGNAASAQDATAATVAQQQAQLLVSRLRQLQASGRIVLDLPVDSHGADALPDLPLEDGDRFIVPRVPSTVGVEGAVYSPNAFLYQPGARLGTYVRMAGGSDRDADVKRAFVIRADGSVVSRQYSSALRGNSFNSIRLYPGDTVVVPQNLNKGATLRTFVDVATIVGQFGLAAAAINLVK
jgi:protein involved in polysaccharide export with SLBB domain